MTDKDTAVEAFSKVWWGIDNPVISQGNAELIWSGIQAAFSALTNTSGDDEAPVELLDEKPDAVESRPEWIWYCESTSGVPVVTFGRWAKYPQQARYKLAAIQPTEHDHPAARPQSAAVRDGLEEAIRNFMPLAEVAFLWTKETPPKEEVDRYREAYWSVRSALHSTQEG